MSPPDAQHLLIITDAGDGQVNGVVNTLHNTSKHLVQRRLRVSLIDPGGLMVAGEDQISAPKELGFHRKPLKDYPEINLVRNFWRLIPEIKRLRPDFIHIATEGPLGLTARRFCGRQRAGFTTSYHTNFDLYAKQYRKVPIWLSNMYLRFLHGPAHRTLVPTPSMKRVLESKGFKSDQLVTWTRGVDTALFSPARRDSNLAQELEIQGPVLLSVGRVAREKNLEAFLKLKIPGTKLIVGKGPYQEELEVRFADEISANRIKFVGEKSGEELARYFASADVFVFPSRTDTFGNVMIEAMASGIPVAAYPVTGPIDVVADGKTGVLDNDLEQAIECALALDPKSCRPYVEEAFTWGKAAHIMREALVPIPSTTWNR